VEDQNRPWEREDLSPRLSAMATIKYHRAEGRDDPEFLKDEVIRVLSEHLVRAFTAGCRRQLERTGGDIESLFRRPAELNDVKRTIDETLDELRAHVLGLFRRYGLEMPDSFLQGWPTNVFFDWHEELRAGRFPEGWGTWGFREPSGEKREKDLSNFDLACDYAKWTLVQAVEIKRSLDVTWQLWTVPLGYGELANTLSETLALLAQIRPEHVIDGLKSHRAGKHGKLGAKFGARGGSPPNPVKAALVQEIRRRLRMDEDQTAEDLFYSLDGKTLEVEAEENIGDGTDSCRMTVDRSAVKLHVETPKADRRISLRTFEGYVTKARLLDGSQ